MSGKHYSHFITVLSTARRVWRLQTDRPLGAGYPRQSGHQDQEREIPCQRGPTGRRTRPSQGNPSSPDADLHFHQKKKPKLYN